MQMDALHCGYPHAASIGMGGGVPITPPATPTQDISRTPTFSSLSSSCSESDYSKHEYTQQEYSQPEYSQTSYSTDSSYSLEEDYTPSHSLSPPESPMTTPKSTPTHTTSYMPRSTSTTSSSQSTPVSQKSTSSSNRKNSFVYDVRLTDEQFLFFVPDFDLVKSHLMFAVREEVEVLKEKISELMERITQLEYENTVLRQYATQEALQQLQQPHHSSNT
ncbi:hypothetical protein SK128_017614 [Halocaridina rubra]|uniref:Uncharacterized protein n=1 Tax=Halocaridina rubra TaxID=373956 RepID=A0AAN9AHL0_HALRR